MKNWFHRKSLSSVEAVRDFARTHLEPHAVERDQAKRFPRDVLALGGELGLDADGDEARVAVGLGLLELALDRVLCDRDLVDLAVLQEALR